MVAVVVVVVVIIIIDCELIICPLSYDKHNLGADECESVCVCFCVCVCLFPNTCKHVLVQTYLGRRSFQAGSSGSGCCR